MPRLPIIYIFLLDRLNNTQKNILNTLNQLTSLKRIRSIIVYIIQTFSVYRQHINQERNYSFFYLNNKTETNKEWKGNKTKIKRIYRKYLHARNAVFCDKHSEKMEVTSLYSAFLFLSVHLLLINAGQMTRKYLLVFFVYIQLPSFERDSSRWKKNSV